MLLTCDGPLFLGELTITPNIPAGAMMSIIFSELDIPEGSTTPIIGSELSTFAVVLSFSRKEEEKGAVRAVASDAESTASPDASPLSAALSTVIFLDGFLCLDASNSDTSVAFISRTSTSSTATTLSWTRISPISGLSSFTLTT